MREVYISLAAGLYTLTILGLGIILGYLLGAKEEKIDQRKKRLANIARRWRNRNEQSGTVKPKVTTYADAEAEDRKPFIERFKEVMGNKPPDDGIGFLDQ